MGQKFLNKLKIYKVRYKIFKANKKYKAVLNKGSNFLILCGSSTREIYNLLLKTIIPNDKRPIKNKKKLKSFIVDDGFKKYIFVLRKENINEYLDSQLNKPFFLTL